MLPRWFYIFACLHFCLSLTESSRYFDQQSENTLGFLTDIILLTIVNIKKKRPKIKKRCPNSKYSNGTRLDWGQTDVVCAHWRNLDACECNVISRVTRHRLLQAALGSAGYMNES